MSVGGSWGTQREPTQAQGEDAKLHTERPQPAGGFKSRTLLL